MTASSVSIWARKPFKRPDTTFQGQIYTGSHSGEEMPMPYEYLSQYVTKSVLAELAKKANTLYFRKGAP